MDKPRDPLDKPCNPLDKPCDPLGDINKRLVNHFVNIGRKHCNITLNPHDKYLIRLLNGLCFISKGGDVSEKFGQNTYINLVGQPGIYCRGDEDFIDYTFEPRLLYRIMEIKCIDNMQSNGMWENDKDMNLYHEKYVYLIDN
jgi:hypothetical protein